MTTLLIIIVSLVVAGVLAETLREAFHDGAGHQGPPRSHHEDRQFLPPARA